MGMGISRLLWPLALGLLMLAPAQAQTRDANRAACLSSDNDTSIAGCTADINSGEETTPEDLALAYYNRCIGYTHKSEYDAAISDCTRAIALNPNKASFHVGLGEAYYNSHNVAAAVDEFHAALRIDPGNEDAQEDLADAGGG